MSCQESKDYVRLIDKLFVSGLWRWRWRRLRSHLAECAHCRAYYDRVARVWQAMGPGATPRVVAESLAEDLLLKVGARPSPRWTRALAGAALAAAVALVLVIGLRPGAPVVGEWRERGLEARRARGVRAFCIGGLGQDMLLVRAAASSVRTDGAPAELRCRLEDSLQFAYTLGPGPGAAEHLVLVGRDATGQLHWYSAPPENGPAIALRAGVQDEPLPASVRLGVRHPAGRVVVDAFFAERPLAAAEVRRALEERRDPAVLPGVVEHQRLMLSLER